MSYRQLSAIISAIARDKGVTPVAVTIMTDVDAGSFRFVVCAPTVTDEIEVAEFVVRSIVDALARMNGLQKDAEEEAE
jgi:hypothetical protein